MHSTTPVSDRQPNAQLPADALAQLFGEARSYNRWQHVPVDDERIRLLYDTLSMGPTSANGSPGRFVWVRSDAEKERLAGCVKAGNEVKVRTAPLTVIIGYDLKFYENFSRLMPHAVDKLVPMFEYDPKEAQDTAFRNSSLQGAYLIMAARALGLDCGPMSGFHHDRVNAQYFAGTTIKANFLCCIGIGSLEELYPRGARLPYEEINWIL